RDDLPDARARPSPLAIHHCNSLTDLDGLSARLHLRDHDRRIAPSLLRADRALRRCQTLPQRLEEAARDPATLIISRRDLIAQLLTEEPDVRHPQTRYIVNIPPVPPH